MEGARMESPLLSSQAYVESSLAAPAPPSQVLIAAELHAECMESCRAGAWAIYCFISGCGFLKLYSIDSASNKCSMMVFVGSDGIHILNHTTSKHCSTNGAANTNDFHAAKQAGRKKYKYKWQPQLGWHAKEIFTNQRSIHIYQLEDHRRYGGAAGSLHELEELQQWQSHLLHEEELQLLAPPSELDAMALGVHDELYRC